MTDPQPTGRQIRVELTRSPRSSGLLLPGQPPMEDYYDILIDGQLAFRYDSVLHLAVNHWAMSENIKRLEASLQEAVSLIEQLRSRIDALTEGPN